MKKIIIPKEQLYQKYIIENLSRTDCAQFFNVSEKVIIRRLAEYGIKKEKFNIQIIRENTMMKRYGVSHPSRCEAFKQKAKKVMLFRYGVEYTAQSKDLQSKMQKTMSERYGKPNYVETGDFKIKSSKTCRKKHGTDWPCQFPQCIKALETAIGHSKPERHFAEILDKHNISYEQEFPIRGFKYDFKIDNTLFEINPSGTHNVNFGLFGHEPKKKDYHFIKQSVAKEYNYHCVHVFDWDDQDKIVKVFLEPKEKVYARLCSIREVPVKEARVFLNQNHLQSYAKDTIRLGLYQNNTNELVEIMTFDKPRYNKKYEYELVRLCSVKNVIGGTEKLLNHFVKHYKPKSIISYCDLSKFDGTIYRKLGFTATNKPQPSKHWVSLKTGQHITDNLLRKCGFDKLFKTHYGKGTSNEQLMRENGFVEVYDCGQIAYTKTYQ